MDKIYIFGHKKPDTDSVTSAIALSYLKNTIGYDTEPYVLGHLNNETEFVLNQFNIKKPKYLNDVKLQIKDVNYKKKCFLNDDESIYGCYKYMFNNSVSGLPIVDKHGIMQGMITIKDICKELINGNLDTLNTSYNNIVDSTKGNGILKYDDEIKGKIFVASYRSTSFIQNIKLDNSSILIVGDRHSIIEYAVNSGVKMIIITGDGEIKSEHLEIAKTNNINIIRTNLDTFTVTKKIGLCNYISTILTNINPISFEYTDFLNRFIDISNKLKLTNYPVVDKKNRCYGLLKISDISDKNSKKVILVDHNEIEQSVDGIEEAKILEIIDHHKIGSINTTFPINFRNMVVGSTNTIIYTMYMENKIEIPKDIAGLMLSGILSDTLILSSPTTTDLDRRITVKLADICNLDYHDYGLKMIKAGTSIRGKIKEDVIYTDFKEFSVGDKKIGIGQIFTMNFEEIKEELNQYISIIERDSVNNNYFLMGLVVTDVIKNGSYILYNEKSKSILENSLDIKELYQGYYLDGCVSRKKQIIPYIMEELEK